MKKLIVTIALALAATSAYAADNTGLAKKVNGLLLRRIILSFTTSTTR